MLAKRFSRQDEFDAVIAAAGNRYGVEPALIKAVIARESGFNPKAYNPNDPGGAWGLMQVIEATARGLGHLGPMSDLFDPATAVNLGAKYLGQQQLRYRGVVADTVASYNAGSARLGSAGGYINQAYVDGVLGFWAYFRAYAAERGGVAPVASTFPGSHPDSPGGLVDVPTGSEGVSLLPGPENSPGGLPGPGNSPKRELPTFRVPVLASIVGAGLWAALYFATCGG